MCVRGRRRGQSGFSLVEVMVAFTILGVGLLSVAAAQVKAIHGTRAGRHLSQAGLVAQSQLDQLTRSPWTEIAPTGWTVPIAVETTVVDGAAGAVEQTYDVRWQIQDVLANETRSIDVQVAWTEADGRNRTVAASTIRFNVEDD
jgi:prepilin-type N-terminal cleavage/methylation domain-containing protein